jgi:hypothetical protein
MDFDTELKIVNCWHSPILHCYYLTPWIIVLERLKAAHLVEKFPTSHGTRWFIAEFTITPHSTLSGVILIQSTACENVELKEYNVTKIVQSDSDYLHNKSAIQI